MDKLCIIVKILAIFIIILIFYKLSNRDSGVEGFETIDYMKLNETYLEADGTNLELLYSNYTGDSQNAAIWENKTLDQCTDLCNQLDNCIGFSRELVNDDAPAKCMPRTKIGLCHSNRRGDMLQMQNAIKHNSYVKTGTKNVLTKCIGDTRLTLNRSVFIKSHMYPKKYIGSVGDGVLMLIDINDEDFNKKCNFRIEIGKDGIGTVAFLHIDSNMYLYRSTLDNTLILKTVATDKTNDKQRVSFNILDGMKNLMKFRCLQLDGETIERYITINPANNNYLVCAEYDSQHELDTIFSIVDNIVKSKIITNPSVSISDNDKRKEKFVDTKLDTTNDIPLYKNVFTTPTTVNIKNYINDNYDTATKYFDVSKKLTDNVLDNQLSKSLSKKQNEYDNMRQLNLEIEKELANLNMGLNAKNDHILQNINKMRITDMADDYFTLTRSFM